MEKKLEGIVLSKDTYREKDLIVWLLLREGTKIPVVFYGGKGGGAKEKGSVLEFGNLIKTEVSKSRSSGTNSSMFVAKESSLSWQHKAIRNNPRAFFDLCFYLEMAKKIAQDADENVTEQDDGVFRVLSNALFYLDEISVKNESNYLGVIRFLFLVKLTIAEGLFPDLSSCVLCGQNYEKHHKIYLAFDHGGFQCESCSKGESSNDRDLLNYLSDSSKTSFKNFHRLNVIYPDQLNRFTDYFLFQIGLTRSDLKTVRNL